MVPIINPQPQFVAVNDAPIRAPQFAEGAMGTVAKVVAFALAAIASVVSFLILPFESAFFTTLGAGLAAAFIACSGNTQAEEGNQRWWHTAFRWLPTFAEHPVRQPGPRVAVGAGYRRPAYTPIPQAHVINARRAPMPQRRADPVRMAPVDGGAQRGRIPVRQPGSRVGVGANRGATYVRNVGHRVMPQNPVQPNLRPVGQRNQQQPRATPVANQQDLPADQPPQIPRGRVPVGRGHQ